MSLISLANFKSFIHMGETHDDTELQSVIDGVEAEIATRIGYDLIQTTTTEFHNGDRSNTILLDNGMVTVVPTVDVDSNGDYTYATNLVDKQDFVWYTNGVIQLITGGYFPRRQRYVRVIYTHGYLTNPLVATLLPRNIPFAVYKDRPVKVCNGDYAGLAGVINLRSGPNNTGATYTESTDYAVMEVTGEVVVIETAPSLPLLVNGSILYIGAGTYTELSNLPLDIESALKKKMANVYHSSLGAIEIESETPYKIYTDKEIYGVIDRYARVQI